MLDGEKKCDVRKCDIRNVHYVIAIAVINIDKIKKKWLQWSFTKDFI